MRFASTLIATLFIGFLAAVPASAASLDTMERVKSAHSVEETAEKAEAFIEAKKWKVFGRFDHAAAAAEFGKQMAPTIVVIFGNPAAGTGPMNKNRLLAIDLPLKALAYQDDNGDVWFAYNTGEWVAEQVFGRHGFNPNPDGMNTLFAAMAKAATE
jgi:uncharacterized protein (DUF302 family)